MADNHGDILGLPQVIKTMQAHSDEILENGNAPSTENILAISGDYFMNPGKKAMLTKPRKTFGDVQFTFLKKLIFDIKKYFGPNSNFHTIYTPGNHCYGGGDEWLYNKLEKEEDIRMDTIMSNIDLEKSPLLARLLKKSNNLSTQKIYEIKDDKNPNLKNHVLFLGVNIPSYYYNPKELLKYTTFLDQTTKNDAAMDKKDLSKTIKELNRAIRKFKEKHPRGAVVLMSHLGNKLSNIIAENVPNINVILNAHDHKDFCTLIGSTQILSHGQNNKFFRTVNLFFDDDGNLKLIRNAKYNTAPYIRQARNDDNLQDFVNRELKEDLKPLVKFDEKSGTPEETVFDNSMRYKNSVLGNYITTAIKDAAAKRYPNIDVVGIPSTIIRSGLRSNINRTTFNNIDLINMFKGVDESVSGLRVAELTGEELLYLVAENVVNNLKSPTRNALILWSDIQVNKKMFAKDGSKFELAIKIRNPKTGKFEKINSKKKYNVLLTDKYLLKTGRHYRMPQMLFPKFKPIEENYETLFREYLAQQGNKVRFTDKTRELRVISQ
ncbi:MAG: hypothetical protein K6A44_03705 [bacterium]|nr:hypothetical protein [bacterium]